MFLQNIIYKHLRLGKEETKYENVNILILSQKGDKSLSRCLVMCERNYSNRYFSQKMKREKKTIHNKYILYIYIYFNLIYTAKLFIR